MNLTPYAIHLQWHALLAEVSGFPRFAAALKAELLREMEKPQKTEENQRSGKYVVYHFVDHQF